ncbi:MAG: hypothetical protein IT204_02775 [Fimbriimonadaceae bacterium]|nr:hypothetical protein [Fimbriimonadaceae bacterium]
MAFTERVPDERFSSASRATSSRARGPESGLERRAAPLSGRELLPMGLTLMLIGAIAALLILYLTAFGRLSAQGARAAELDREIREISQQNQGLHVARDGRRQQDRLEREAQRLGLVPAGAVGVQRVEVPAGYLEASEPVAAQPAVAPVQTSQLPR